jgi:hypothetical protein
MAMFLASGDELGSMKNQVAAIVKEKETGVKPRFAQLDSESDSNSSSDSDDDEEDTQLDADINMTNNLV